MERFFERPGTEIPPLS